MTFVPGPFAHPIFKKVSLVCAVGLLALVAVPRASAQGFNVIYQFSGNGTGANPAWSPTVDRFGNVYATAPAGGIGNCDGGCGLVLKGTPHGSRWIWTYLHQFTNGPDGGYPGGPVLLDRAAALYGAAESSNFGLVYELRPSATRPASVISPWNESVLYDFNGAPAGIPSGQIVFDAGGNIYGATIEPFGTVYQLTPVQGGWTENTLYVFQGGSDNTPSYGVTIDSNRNLYGVTSGDGSHCGTVFELTNTGSGWSKGTLYTFPGLSDGCYPLGWLTRDSAGNLYGTAFDSFGSGPSVVYELSPSGGGWTFSVIQSFSGPAAAGSLALDSSGNLYGTVGSGGNGLGSIYKLTHSGGGWTYTSLHDFDASGAEGQYPQGVTMDSHGNLFGVMTAGGPPNANCTHNGCGTIWELMQ
jgi:hypothetical protein